MHDGQAMHETRQFVCDWRDYEMPMIRHDAEGNQASGHALESCGDHFLKRAMVPVVAEYGYAAHGPVRDVKDLPVSL